MNHYKTAFFFFNLTSFTRDSHTPSVELQPNKDRFLLLGKIYAPSLFGIKSILPKSTDIQRAGTVNTTQKNDDYCLRNNIILSIQHLTGDIRSKYEHFTHCEVQPF